MNPNSSYYLSFDTGFPNAVDRANGRTGKYLMVHGTCSSAGCFAMTDATIAEIYAVARDAFIGGQRSFQFQSYPFRMTAENMAKFRNDPNIAFWQNLKEGSDYFEALHEEPKVGQCGTKYVFGGADAAAGACRPHVDPLVAEKSAHDARAVADLVAKGTPAVRVVYQDGGQNPVFRPQNASAFASLGGTETVLPYDAKEYGRHNLGDVSRPETLAAGPQEIEVGPKGRPTMLAGAEPEVPARAARGRRQGARARAAAPAAPTTLMARNTPRAGPRPRVGTCHRRRRRSPPGCAVAGADGDPSAYPGRADPGEAELAEDNPAKDNPAKDNPAPATPAAEAARRHPSRSSSRLLPARYRREAEPPRRLRGQDRQGRGEGGGEAALRKGRGRGGKAKP